MCKRCKEPLALVETARDVGQDIFKKNATVTTRIAQRCELPAYVLFYKVDQGGKIEGFRVVRMAPHRSQRQQVVTPSQWVGHLRSIHADHEKTTCSRVNRVLTENRSYEIKNQTGQVVARCTESADGVVMVEWQQTRFASVQDLSRHVSEVQLTVTPNTRSNVVRLREFKGQEDDGEVRKAA